MTTTLNSRILSWVAGAALALLPSLAQGAHESNNRALLMSEDGPAYGSAIVNYVKGRESWTATVQVHGLPAGVYWFAVRLNDGELQPVCMIEADGDGVARCSNQQFDLGGFNEAVIVDDEGGIVASGIFERRGGKRVSD
mgnify:FL=1